MENKANYALIPSQKIAFKLTAKCGSTSLRMIALNDMYPEEEFIFDENFYTNSEERGAVVYEVPKGYRTIMFVRNPFSRIYSSCLKVLGSTEIEKFISRNIIRTDPHFHSYESYISQLPEDTIFYRWEQFDENLGKILGKDKIPHVNPNPQKKDYQKEYTMKARLAVAEVYGWDIKAFNYTFSGYGELPKTIAHIV